MIVKKIAFPVIICLALILPGCGKPVPPGSPTQVPANPDNPLTGEWRMTRESIEPKLQIPDAVLSMYLNNNPVWKIAPTLLSGTVVTYDGRETWFAIPRFGVQEVSIQTNPAKGNYGYGSNSKITSLTLNGGGTVNVGRVNSILGLTPRVEKISATYLDKVTITSISPDEIKATLEVNLKSGEYMIEDEDAGGVMVKKFIAPYRATINYIGQRKK